MLPRYDLLDPNVELAGSSLMQCTTLLSPNRILTSTSLRRSLQHRKVRIMYVFRLSIFKPIPRGQLFSSLRSIERLHALNSKTLFRRYHDIRRLTNVSLRSNFIPRNEYFPPPIRGRSPYARYKSQNPNGRTSVSRRRAVREKGISFPRVFR